MSELDDVTTVYAGPLLDFVARRDALAKARRAAGDRAAADLVKAIRKPSRNAWALNRASSSEQFGELVSAARSIVAAQSSGRDVREAMSALRTAVRNFASHASAAAAAEGINLESSDLVTDTFAVLGDSAAFDRLARGALAEIPEAGSLDFLTTMTAPPTLTVSSGGEATKPTSTKSRSDDAAQRRRDAKAALAEAESQLEQTRKATEPALRALNVAETELTKAEYRLEQAHNAVDTARDVRDRARQAATEASERIRAVEARVTELRKTAEERA